MFVVKKMQGELSDSTWFQTTIDNTRYGTTYPIDKISLRLIRHVTRKRCLGKFKRKETQNVFGSLFKKFFVVFNKHQNIYEQLLY